MEARNLKVMAVSAHPADFCSRAGGTLIKHVRAGSKVRVVWLSHGETNESQLLFQQKPDISLGEVRRIREREAFAAAEAVGAEGRMFGFGDNPLRMTAERVEMLAGEIADFKPDIILTHWKDELTYASHWQTAQAAILAAQLANGSWDIRFFEPNIGTAARVGFVPDHYVDISDVFERKLEALRKLAAQPRLVPDYTTCNRWRGIEIGRPYAEAFVRWAPKPVVLDLLEP
ncbi:MAG: PIG-L family deacetylase [Acidobacteria bacterium]|nr:PIG-L family deacetylase [Acidobacteriota bacterium]